MIIVNEKIDGEIDTGDTVYTPGWRIRWIAAFSDKEGVHCLGANYFIAKKKDCYLVKKSPKHERDKLLRGMAGMSAKDDDRRLYAIERLKIDAEKANE